MSDLPNEVDCVILGTGLTNSIVAASCARVGKSVLHLDSKSHYGDDWASFTFEQLVEWARSQQEGHLEGPDNYINEKNTYHMRRKKNDSVFSNVNVIVSERLTRRKPSDQARTVTNIDQEPSDPKRIKKEQESELHYGSGDNVDDKVATEKLKPPTIESGLNEEIDWTKDKLLEKSKLFCIDLNPKLLYSNGALVELLVKSNVARYHEFKNSVRLVALIDGHLEVLPCKRNEVFSSQILPSLIDKRRLMQFIELCVSLNEEKPEESELNDYLQMDIEKCLIERNLGPNLRHLLINSLAMVNPDTPTLMVCKNIKKFLLSVERFGKSPFLFPIYGCGEFPQSFSRMCAVFGGVYCLNKQVETLSIDQSDEPLAARLTLKLDDEKIIKCRKLVLNYSHAVTAKIISCRSSTLQSRAILITTSSFFSESDDQITFLRLATGSMSNKYPIYLLEVNASVMVCPIGLNIVYIWTNSHEQTATEDLLPIVKSLYDKKGSKTDPDVERQGPVLWSCYFNKLTDRTDYTNLRGMQGTDGIMVTSLNASDIDYECTIDEASKIFQAMYPGEDFLPRAPDPDEIIFDAQDAET